MQLLNIDQNAKTVKGQSKGFLTGIMYLAPADLSGYNTCAMAEKAGCKTPCLNSAGMGAFSNVQKARIERTKLFFENRHAFAHKLIKEINALIKKAHKLGLTPTVRLNGTSDIKWESVQLIDGKTIFEIFPDIQFYDYTKIANRTNLPSNYDLTFSYSGVISFAPYVKKALETDIRVAVVFENENFPETFLNRIVTNGDDTDLRFLDQNKTIVALYAKGKAKKDQSGFVVRQ